MKNDNSSYKVLKIISRLLFFLISWTFTVILDFRLQGLCLDLFLVWGYGLSLVLLS